jgi:hypothetical protein
MRRRIHARTVCMRRRIHARTVCMRRRIHARTVCMRRRIHTWDRMPGLSVRAAQTPVSLPRKAPIGTR